MADVIVEYGAIYWTQNNTLYPTTTTTTTVSVKYLLSRYFFFVLNLNLINKPLMLDDNYDNNTQKYDSKKN